MRGAVILQDRHCVLKRDAEHRLHCDDGPAVAYPDGWAIHAWHGLRVEPRLIENPETITIKEIDGESNAELRRVKIERYGRGKFVIDSGAKVIHSDDWGTLYRREMPDSEPLVMVKVVNSTREQDGSCKSYWLRVPPGMQTARQAVAWTFGKEETTYVPQKQT